MKMYLTTKNELPTSRLSKVVILARDRQTYATEMIYHTALPAVSNLVIVIIIINNINYANNKVAILITLFSAAGDLLVLS